MCVRVQGEAVCEGTEGVCEGTGCVCVRVQGVCVRAQREAVCKGTGDRGCNGLCGAHFLSSAATRS